VSTEQRLAHGIDPAAAADGRETVSSPVYFHVGRHGHPFFTEQLRCAPSGFSYRTDEAGRGGAGGTRLIALRRSRLRGAREILERVAIRGLSRAGHVRRVSLDPPAGCELIHSAQHLVRDSPLPYVVDFECLEAFCLYQRVTLSRPWARRRLLAALADERCRLLMPWSDAARRGVESVLGPEAAGRLAGKTQTVLPAITPMTEHPHLRQPGPLRVLFIGTAFVPKGGVEAVRAVQAARDSHEVTLDLISDVPAGRQAELGGAKGVTAHPWPAPPELVRELFTRADVLLFPSHMDTLGFVMLEAMANGVPVLASRHFATPELVEDEVSGLLVEGENLLYGDDGLCRFQHTLPPPRAFASALARPSEAYVGRLASALTRLAEEPGLYERLAAGALERVSTGPLSPDRRRATLGECYRRARGA
jgi:glycosyltransferase involved in cell wall biosynthesis